MDYQILLNIKYIYIYIYIYINLIMEGEKNGTRGGGLWRVRRMAPGGCSTMGDCF